MMTISAGRERVRKHIRQTLGPILKEWEERVDGLLLPFAIAQLDAQPASHANCFVTMGLSDAELQFPSGNPMRQELVFACHRAQASRNVQGLLAAVALERTESGCAFARGDVEGPAGFMFPSTNLQALYASLPSYFPDGFSKDTHTSPSTHFMWMIPITAAEASFVARGGWSAFEDELVKQDPDLLDLNRTEIKFPALRLTKQNE
jgi:hypothetical protein